MGVSSECLGGRSGIGWLVPSETVHKRRSSSPRRSIARRSRAHDLDAYSFGPRLRAPVDNHGPGPPECVDGVYRGGDFRFSARSFVCSAAPNGDSGLSDLRRRDRLVSARPSSSGRLRRTDFAFGLLRRCLLHLFGGAFGFSSSLSVRSLSLALARESVEFSRGRLPGVCGDVISSDRTGEFSGAGFGSRGRPRARLVSGTHALVGG